MKYGFMKRTAAFLAALAMLSMTACSDSEKDSEKKTSESKAAASEADDSVPVVTLPESDTPESTAESTAEDTSSEESDPSEQYEETEYAPAMWKVTSPEGSTIYMMGSMHALKKECYPLPDYIQAAYDNADVLAVECDITDMKKSMSASLKQLDKLYFEEGTLADHLPEEQYNNIKAFLESFGQDISVYENFQLWYLSQALDALLIQNSGLDTTIGLDAHLLNDAHNDNKEIYEVETIDFQMDLLLGYSEETYALLLDGYDGENKQKLTDELLELYGAWRTGDLDYVTEQNTEDPDKIRELVPDITDDEIELYLNYNQTLLFDRNVGMAEAAEKLMSEGKNTLYVVGLAHYAGEKGIISLLEKDGCTCERITEYPA